MQPAATQEAGQDADRDGRQPMDTQAAAQDLEATQPMLVDAEAAGAQAASDAPCGWRHRHVHQHGHQPAFLQSTVQADGLLY